MDIDSMSIRSNSHDNTFPNEIFSIGAIDIARRIKAADITSKAVIEAYFGRIEKLNPKYNALVRLNKDSAIEQAEMADLAVADGRSLGPLHGVPITLKDVHDTSDMETSHCHPSLAGRCPSEDGVVAKRLRAAGAIIIGKTNFTHYPDNPFGPSVNPWGENMILQGSSAGSAVAVSAGLSALDVGSDIGGSIIVPAAFCGLYAMRPTEKRVPVSPCPMDKIRLWRYFMTYGPLARNINDIELAVELLSGPDEFDTEVPRVTWKPVYLTDPKSIRIAWCCDFPKAHVDDDVRAKIEEVMNSLTREGISVERSIPDLPLWKAILNWSKLVYQMLLPVGSKHFLSNEEHNPTLAEFLVALEKRDDFTRAWEHFLSRYDAFVLPAFGTTSWPMDQVPPPNNASFSAALSAATGQPSVIMPIGVSSSQQPIGVQVIGKKWTDEKLLSITKILANFTKGFQSPPTHI